MDDAVLCFDAQPIGLDRGEVGATGNQRNLGSTLCKPSRDMPADRTGAVHANSHTV
jgi:hypothetical protein